MNSRDFENFLESQGPGPSPRVHEALKSLVEAERPRPARTATKLAATHLTSSMVVLTLCPQFGLRLFFDGHGLMHYFMFAGDWGCWFLCGFFYLAITAFLARAILLPADWGLLRTRKALWVPSLLGLTMGTLIMASGAVSIEYGLFWLVGSVAALWWLTPGRIQPILNSTIKG